MSVYIAIVDNAEDANKVAGKLKTHYPDHYSHHGSENVFFLRESNDIAETIATKLGFGSDKPIAGAVFKLNADYYGFTRPGIWQWLRKSDG